MKLADILPQPTSMPVVVLAARALDHVVLLLARVVMQRVVPILARLVMQRVVPILVRVVIQRVVPILARVVMQRVVPILVRLVMQHVVPLLVRVVMQRVVAARPCVKRMLPHATSAPLPVVHPLRRQSRQRGLASPQHAMLVRQRMAGLVLQVCAVFF